MTSKPKYEIVDINNIEAMADVSLLQKKDELFFTATNSQAVWNISLKIQPLVFVRRNSMKNQENTEALKAIASRVAKAECLLSHGKIDDTGEALRTLLKVLPKPDQHNIENQEDTEALKAIASLVAKAEYLLSHGKIDDTGKVLRDLLKVLPKPDQHNIDCAQ
jgi:hypothetical protein